MDAMAKKAFDVSSLDAPAIKSSSIFEEVPVVIHNPKVVDAVLLELDGKTDVDCDFKRLELSFNPFLERVLEYLVDQVDELASHQSNAHYWSRKLFYQKRQQDEYYERLRAKNEERVKTGQKPLPEVPDTSLQCFKPLPEGARQDKLESLLVSAQISTYCRQINAFAGASFGKLFLARSVVMPSSST